jgi:hypothetical protein
MSPLTRMQVDFESLMIEQALSQSRLKMENFIQDYIDLGSQLGKFTGKLRQLHATGAASCSVRVTGSHLLLSPMLTGSQSPTGTVLAM